MACDSPRDRCIASRHWQYLRKGFDWSEQFVHVSPTWPATYLTNSAPKDMLISCVGFCAASWTVVFTQAATVDALADAPDASARAACMPVTQKVLVEDTWPSEGIAALLAIGYTITTIGHGPDAMGSRRVHVVVLTRSPSTIVPRTMRSFGTFPLLESWRSELRPWHCNWAAVQGVKIAASQTTRAPMRRRTHRTPKDDSERGYKMAHCDLLGCSVLNALDGDAGSYWYSGGVPLRSHLLPSSSTTPADSTLVTIVIDLGEARHVDQVRIFWGDTAARPMPSRWDLVGSPKGTIKGCEKGAAFLWAVDPRDGADTSANATADAKCEHSAGRSLVSLAAPRELRVLELHLRESDEHSYAIRQIQVLGPGPADADPNLHVAMANAPSEDVAAPPGDVPKPTMPLTRTHLLPSVVEAPPTPEIETEEVAVTLQPLAPAAPDAVPPPLVSPQRPTPLAEITSQSDMDLLAEHAEKI